MSSQVESLDFPQRARAVARRPATLPVGRRRVPVRGPIMVAVLTGGYGLLAISSPIIGSAPTAVVVLTILFALAAGTAFLSTNRDLLDPIRVVSVYYIIAFCVAPLAMNQITWHYRAEFSHLLPPAAVYVLATFVLTILGYFLPLFGRLPAVSARKRGTHSTPIVFFVSLCLLGAGLVSYVLLFVLQGGIQGLFYSDVGRSWFFMGFGYWFWGAILLFPGSLLFFVACCEARKPHPLLGALPALATFGLFLVLQGRMRALNALVLVAFASHYLVRRLAIRTLGIFAVAGLLLSMFVGYARAPSVRTEAILQPKTVIQQVADNIDRVGRGFVVGDLSRLRQIVLIMDAVPRVMPRDWGRSLLTFINPWVRLIGMKNLEIPPVGPRLFRLAHPAAPLDLRTGYLASFPGEMLVNFPWYLAIFAFIPYGIALRYIYFRLVLRRGDFVAIALYSFLLLFLANIVLQSLGHVIMETLVIFLPLLLANFLSRGRARVVSRPVG